MESTGRALEAGAPRVQVTCIPELSTGGARSHSRRRRHLPTMLDPFGRKITYLRVSVTDRCDLRCVYCMAEDMTFLPKRDLLTLEELDRICAAFIRLGTNKIRITGGEPLVRRDVMKLFGSLGARLGEGGLKELVVTTNGTQLAKLAGALHEAGVRRI